MTVTLVRMKMMILTLLFWVFQTLPLLLVILLDLPKLQHFLVVLLITYLDMAAIPTLTNPFAWWIAWSGNFTILFLSCYHWVNLPQEHHFPWPNFLGPSRQKGSSWRKCDVREQVWCMAGVHLDWTKLTNDPRKTRNLRVWPKSLCIWAKDWLLDTKWSTPPQ